MARIGKETLRVRDDNDRDFYIEITFVIHVGADGYFTATLEESDIKLIKSYGVELFSNSRSAKSGFFKSKTKEELLTKVYEVLRQCISKELIREETVIKYSFLTNGSFGFTLDGKIVPNMGWGYDGELNNDLYWQGGTVQSYAATPNPTMVQMYVKPYFKRTYKYSSGEEKTFYYEQTAFGNNEVNSENYHLAWLRAICSTVPPSRGQMREIEYTEDRAKFFVELYKSLCRLSHTIAKFEAPDNLIKLIETGKYLM